MFEKQTALVVDDSKQIVQIVSKLLKDELGFEKVLTSDNAKAAISIIRENQIDWIICDWEMPEVSGYDFLKAIRKSEKTRSIPFIMMTSRADKESLVLAAKAGVSDYITKPFTQATFIERIKRQVLIQERRISKRIDLAGKFSCEIKTAAGATVSGDIINLSNNGCLLRTSVIKEGGNVYDEVEIKLKLNTYVHTISSIVRVQAENDKRLEQQKFVQMAVKFEAVSDENMVLLQDFIDEPR